MSTIPSVDLGMAALSGIASANISIAVPVLSQNLCYVAIPDSRTGAACVWRSAVGALTPTFPTRSPVKNQLRQKGASEDNEESVMASLPLLAVVASFSFDFPINRPSLASLFIVSAIA